MGTQGSRSPADAGAGAGGRGRGRLGGGGGRIGCADEGTDERALVKSRGKCGSACALKLEHQPGPGTDSARMADWKVGLAASDDARTSASDTSPESAPAMMVSTADEKGEISLNGAHDSSFVGWMRLTGRERRQEGRDRAELLVHERLDAGDVNRGGGFLSCNGQEMNVISWTKLEPI